MKLGSLFSGAGLGDLGWTMAGFDIRWQVEIDPYCQKVLDLRFPESKKYHDIKTLKGEELEPVEIVAGGFPCQPFSVAGKQGGDQDDRNLWPQMLRIVKEIRPTWVVGENVSGIIPIYLDTILSDLESAGYATRTFVFPAHSLGASHRRERIWIVGYSDSGRFSGEEKREDRLKRNTKTIGTGQNVADSDIGQTRPGLVTKPNEKEISKSESDYSGGRNEKNVAHTKSNRRKHSVNGSSKEDKKKGVDEQPTTGTRFCPINWGREYQKWGTTQSGICGVTHVRSHRVDRLKALGNGQVVACTAFIGQQIMEFERLKWTTSQTT